MKKTLLKESLSQRISDILRLEIIENAIKEDEFFNETELATRFGVSRGPVREALRILETDCLVATQPNGRTKVLAITADDCRAHYDLRRFLKTKAYGASLHPATKRTIPNGSIKWHIIWSRIAAVP